MRHSAVMPETTSPDELLTSGQSGALLGRSYRTVIRLAETGELPIAQKLPGPNGAYLFRRADVEALADKRAEASA